MSKTLTDKEMLDIITRAPDEIDCQDAYMHFLEDLAELICSHFGGTHNEPFSGEGPPPEYGCDFDVNDCVPDDGGIFRLYDKDVLWKNGKETKPVKKKRIMWLDSCGIPSHTHATINTVDTVCGSHSKYIQDRELIKLPDKALRQSNYCVACFKKGDKREVPWDSRCVEFSQKPCKHCGRKSEHGTWFRPCPSDDCPGNKKKGQK